MNWTIEEAQRIAIAYAEDLDAPDEVVDGYIADAIRGLLADPDFVAAMRGKAGPQTDLRQAAQAALEESASRSADYLRKAIKAEAKIEAMRARQAELVAVLARLYELNAAERPMAKVWGAAQALVDSYKT